MKEESKEEGRSLMISKSLVNIEKEVQESVQRNNLFRASYKTRHSICKVIIDSGSIDNLVSMEMVENVKLDMTSHPNPYKLLWLQKGNQVMVIRQCKVDIKIGGYKDGFLCDVISMDVCHVLMGRTWQYDMNFIHSWRKKTYTLEKNGCNHMLLPIEDKGVKEESSSSILWMKGKELLKEVKKDQKLQFVFVGKMRVIFTSTSMNNFPI
jgi:hypothetical protein